MASIAHTIAVLAIAFWGATLPCRADEAELRWPSELTGGSQTMSHLYEAVSGKRTAKDTKQLMTGVSLIARQDANFRVVRSDGAEMLIPRDSERGQRMFSCMEKLERQARKMVGDDLGNYIKSLDALVIEGNSVVLRHSGEERVTVPLPTNQPWLPVSLKELRLKNIRLRLEEGAENDVHRIKDIDGIVAVVNSAGIDLAIEPRELSCSMI
jgi:hypothetical protein